MEIIAKVERGPGEKNFSCYMHVDSVKAGVLGQGSTARAAMEDMLCGWEEAKADMKQDGIKVPDVEITFSFDIGSLFSYYDFINVAGVSREIGINPSVMRQYAIGKRKPSADRKAAIVGGIRKLAHKMETVNVY